MPDEPRDISDDMLLTDLTVGEFKALLQELLANLAAQPKADDEPQIEAEVTVRRKSLDEFMSDLSGS